MLIRADELFEKIKIARSTLGEWRKKGLPTHKVGGIVFYDLDEVINWIKNYKNNK